MYVHYFLIGGKQSNYYIFPFNAPGTQLYPSECIWMIPGTVDPMED